MPVLGCLDLFIGDVTTIDPLSSFISIFIIRLVVVVIVVIAPSTWSSIGFFYNREICHSRSNEIWIRNWMLGKVRSHKYDVIIWIATEFFVWLTLNLRDYNDYHHIHFCIARRFRLRSLSLLFVFGHRVCCYAFVNVFNCVILFYRWWFHHLWADFGRYLFYVFGTVFVWMTYSWILAKTVVQSIPKRNTNNFRNMKDFV